MVEAANKACDDGFDVYYVTAGFGAGPTAEADNAVAKRELYVDVDCGPNKPYADKVEGARALKTFCKSTGMPQPTIVDSGNGLHAHWIFTDSVPVHEWVGAATRLKALCREKEFHVDSTCTADSVRVLRLPDTINSKNNSAVTLLNEIHQYEFVSLLSVVGQVFIPAKETFTKARELSKGSSGGLTKSLSSFDPNRVNNFETIWLKSVKGEGCAQIQNAIQNADTLSEPVWRGALSIAQYCEDRDWGIHEISKNHPNYTPEETESKAAGTKGPYTCETFQGMETATLCAGCAFSGKLTSPIQLGAVVKTAPPVLKEVVSFGRKYEIPPLPFPYLRGEYGGVYLQVKNDDDGVKTEMIYPHDLYIYRRMRDADMGDVVWMRHHLPNDGVREFMMAQKEIGALDKFRDKLNEQGVTMFAPTQLQRLQAYIARSIQELQAKEKAESMYTRFGWTVNNTFIVGNREYTKNGVVYAPVTRALEKYIPWYTPKGSLDEWKMVADQYNRPEFDMHALGVLAGFGSVLMAKSPESGGVLNYFSKKSGTGKTTILRMINSIFGDPKALMKDAQDTHLTKVHRMGMINGMPLCVDEMTNTSPQELSSLLYGCTQGRARDRMKAGENAERTNDLTWKGISVWSGNTSPEDRLNIIKSDPQGELARLVDIHLRTPIPNDVLEAQKIFNKLNEHYGHAGDIFMRYVIPEWDLEVDRVWTDTRDLIYSVERWTQTERYRLNVIICAIAAGIITNSLGLTRYNLKRIAKSATALVKQAGEELRAQSTKAVESFAAFVNANITNMLSIDSRQRANGLQNEPYIKPRGSLIIRYEPDVGTLYIVQKDFVRWCAENYLNAKEMRSLFREETGQDLEVMKKRMGAGWDADFGAVNVFSIKNAMKTLGLEADDMGAQAE